jgi:hypothetical protein
MTTGATKHERHIEARQEVLRLIDYQTARNRTIATQSISTNQRDLEWLKEFDLLASVTRK